MRRPNTASLNAGHEFWSIIWSSEVADLEAGQRNVTSGSSLSQLLPIYRRDVNDDSTQHIHSGVYHVVWRVEDVTEAVAVEEEEEGPSCMIACFRHGHYDASHIDCSQDRSRIVHAGRCACSIVEIEGHV